jgi:hypothetical protein
MRGPTLAAMWLVSSCGSPTSGSPDTTTTDTGETSGRDTSTSRADATTTTGSATTSTDTSATTFGSETSSETGAPATAWDEGEFRVLPAMSGDLVELVDALAYPQEGDYGMLSRDREARLLAFVDAMAAAIAAGLVDGDAADWCGVLALAADADYALFRFYDVPSERWFLLAEDTTSFGQAYLVVNPEPKRDLVLEVPHHPFDSATAPQGARLLRALAARALVLNKEHRCSDPDPTDCTGNTSVCGGAYRESDVAHHSRNAFHVLHKWWSDRDADTRFVQLHGYDAPDGDHAEVGDGTYNDVDATSIATAFAAALGAHGPDPSSIHACQGAKGPTPSNMCGASNLQGRYTNEAGIDECLDSTSMSSGRFVHLEQSSELRDDDERDGWSWGDVRDAIADVWPDCDLGEALDDCALGPAQAEHPACVCGQPCD